MIELIRMELENFGPFYGKHDINIGDSKKKLVIFEANNGVGKTIITNAFQWCLFGSYYTQHRDDPELADFELFNEDLLLNGKIKDTINARVTLTFKLDEDANERATFSRKMSLKKISDIKKIESGARLINQENFELLKNSDGSHQDFSVVRWIGNTLDDKKYNPTIFRNNYFPNLTKDYYIIYGENFVDPRNPEKLRTAIERNCRLDTFDDIIANLSALEDSLLSESIKETKKKQKVDKLIADKKNYESQLTNLNEQNKKFREEISGLSDEISLIDKKLGAGSSQYVKEITKEREHLNSELTELSRDIREINTTINGEGAKLLIQILTKESEEELSKFIALKVKKGEIPPNIKSEFIDELLDKKTCICGSKIDNEMKKLLIDMRDENTIGKYHNELINLKYELKRDTDSVIPNIRVFQTKIQSLEKKKKRNAEIEKRLNEINQELVALSQTKQLENDRTEKVTKKDSLTEDITKNKERIAGLNIYLAEVERELSRLGSEAKIDASETNRINYVKKLKTIFESLKINILEENKKEIERTTSEIYKKVFRGAYEIDRVEMDMEYNLRVILKNERIKSKFSTGEGLVFAISFLTALRRYAGYSGPIFLDSPFSVLDPEHRDKVALNLPLSIPGQILICTRPDTIENVKDELAKYTNKIFNLEKKKEWHTKISVE